MFVHLRLHTEFSVVDGTCRIDDVLKAAQADGQPALAITDLNNLFGGLKFYKSARSKGVKPVLGAELVLQAHGDQGGSRLLVQVQDHQGYLNLSEILARAWTQPLGKTQTQAQVAWAWLQELHAGLIVLSGAHTGLVGQALLRGDAATASRHALALAEMFPHRFYLELQRAGRAEDEALVAGFAASALVGCRDHVVQLSRRGRRYTPVGVDGHPPLPACGR